MTTLTQASHQWSTRPADERFTSLYDMKDHFATVRNQSREIVVASRRIHALPSVDNKGLEIVSPNGHAYAPTNWAFGQLAQLSEAPAGHRPLGRPCNKKDKVQISEAKQIAGTLGFPSKMPGTSYGIPARACHMGAKLVKVPGSVCHGCYALKGNYRFVGMQKGLAKRLAGLSDPRWVEAMVTMLQAAHGPKQKMLRTGKRLASGWHRWHDSGDLQSVDHLGKICQVAEATDWISHWLPTRELGMVKAYLAKGGKIPRNLTIRVSATMVDGLATGQWPTTSTVHKDKEPTGYVCPAPKQGNMCGKCRMCWTKEPNISYHKH